MNRKKKYKISIYLLKPKKIIEDVLKEEYLNVDKNIITLKDGVFYYETKSFDKPSWVDFFQGELKGISFASSNFKGVYFVNISINSEDLIFAIPFGYGHSMIKKYNCVDDFGLKILLNEVDRKNIRKVGKRTLSSDPKNTIEQLSKAGEVSDFGVDVEQDLIEEITGNPKEGSFFGKNQIYGKVALNVSTDSDISDIKDYLKKCYLSYKKDDYKKDFLFIDNIKEEKDSKKWDEKLINKLKDDSLENVMVWMAVPQIIDWEKISGFCFGGRRVELLSDITLESFKDYLGAKLDELTIDSLKRKRVSAISSSSDFENEGWSCFQCFCCEITEGSNKIILANGKWYKIAKNFADEVEASYQEILENSSDIKYLSCDENKDEGEYNIKLAENIEGGFLMDKKNIVYGGGASRIEFCDVYDSIEKTFIHVKNYYGSSALSHLFAQGRISGQLFVNDEAFRNKVKIKEGLLPFDPSQRPNPRDYKIVFGVISSSEKKLNLPFFSKVNLKNEKKFLEAFGFEKIYLVKIQKLSS